MSASLVGSEMCIRDRPPRDRGGASGPRGKGRHATRGPAWNAPRRKPGARPGMRLQLPAARLPSGP
eukprot:7520429-Alexandrium_andersonii.AAC.1